MISYAQHGSITAIPRYYKIDFYTGSVSLIETFSPIYVNKNTTYYPLVNNSQIQFGFWGEIGGNMLTYIKKSSNNVTVLGTNYYQGNWTIKTASSTSLTDSFYTSKTASEIGNVGGIFFWY